MSKEAVFLGDSLDRLKAFPADARISMGHAIGVAQEGGKVTYAKPLKGIGGGGAAVIEICEDHDGDTYRVMYTAKVGKNIYVLHAFQKKAKKGIATSKADIDIVKDRLKKAIQLAKQEG